jgi:hypothetical protein
MSILSARADPFEPRGLKIKARKHPGVGYRVGRTWLFDENLRSSNAQANMADLERSHAELRAAMILAGNRVRQLNSGRRK